MSRYFFHVKDGSDLLRDPDGQELDGLVAAKQEAIKVARDLMAECLRSSRPLGLERAMVVAEENGGMLSEITFKAALPADDPSR